MCKLLSPLRYPGGKNNLVSYFETIVKENLLVGAHLYEPYAGGASISIQLLQSNLISKATLIEKDPLIYAFWKSVKTHPEALCNNIKQIDVTLKTWHAFQKYLSPVAISQFQMLELGLAGLFFNRVNFSGILNAGPIGGQQQNSEYKIFCRFNKDRLIKQIETIAAQAAPRWVEAVRLFNDRFVDMPFTLSVANQTQAALGKENARLIFTFKDGADIVEWSRAEIRTLSQGEKRALYLLNFIFEVEARKIANKETLFIIDDVADSFDYKNKHAIVQYLEDLTKIANFYQIILTHNFDFFRTLANNFVHRERCLMANRESNSIGLTKADGIKNYFINIWKNRVANSDCILCATIPFTRNLIEYIKGDQDADYLKLTSLLHWKNDTDSISVGEYLGIYNRLFGTAQNTNNPQPVKALLFTKANEICARTTHDGLNLEDKVLLSMAIRMQAEIFVTNKLRMLKSDANYWCQANNQFGSLMKEYASLAPSVPEMRTLEKVSITVSSNIHLNSFMYEPILDLTIEHLVRLYQEVQDL